MKTPFISVILYVEDGASYVGECINSIRRQTFSNFECLVLDDGVGDRSLLKALRAIGKDPRFKIIHSDLHAGAGAARNTALERAKGQYLWFPASEDIVEPLFFANVVEAVREEPDIVVCGITHDMFDHKNEFSRSHIFQPNAESTDEISLSFLFELNKQRLLNPLQNKCFKTSFVKGTRFETQGDAATEDFFFELDLFMRAKRVVCIDDASYHFRRHVARELKFDTTINSFLARHRRVAAFYELLGQRKEKTPENLLHLQELYEQFILDELVRRTNPARHSSAKETIDWISFLKEDPLFIELVKKGQTPTGFFRKRFHSALLNKNAKAALHYAHAAEYARSFGPLQRARDDI